MALEFGIVKWFGTAKVNGERGRMAGNAGMRSFNDLVQEVSNMTAGCQALGDSNLNEVAV